MLHSSVSMHLCFPLGTVKLCFVLKRVTRADPWTARFDKMLNFWTTIVIQIFCISSNKSGQKSTHFESFNKHFRIYYFQVVKNSKQLIIIQLSTTPRNFRQTTCVPCCLFIGFNSLWWTRRKSLYKTIKKSLSSLIMFFSVSSISTTKKEILLQKSTEMKMEGKKSFT